MSPEKQAVAVFWSHKRFWIFQALAIAVWMALALAWFWLPDSRVWGVALSALLGVLVIVGGLWLIGAALLFYSKAHAGLDLPAWRDSLRRVPALLVWGVLLTLAIWASLRLKARMSSAQHVWGAHLPFKLCATSSAIASLFGPPERAPGGGGGYAGSRECAQKR